MRTVIDLRRRWPGVRGWRPRRGGSLALLAAELGGVGWGLATFGTPAWISAAVYLVAIVILWGALGAPWVPPRRVVVARERIVVEDGWVRRSTRWSTSSMPVSLVGDLRRVVPTLRSPYLVLVPRHAAFARPIAVGADLGLSLVELEDARRRLEAALCSSGWRRPSDAPPLATVAAGPPSATMVLPWSHGWGQVAMLESLVPATMAFESARLLGASGRAWATVALFLVFLAHIVVEVWRGSLHRIEVGPQGVEVLGRFRRLRVPLGLVDGVSYRLVDHRPFEDDALGLGRRWTKRSIVERLSRPLSDDDVANRSFPLQLWIGGVALVIPIDRGNREETVREIVARLEAALAAHRAGAAAAA